MTLPKPIQILASDLPHITEWVEVKGYKPVVYRPGVTNAFFEKLCGYCARACSMCHPDPNDPEGRGLLLSECPDGPDVDSCLVASHQRVTISRYDSNYFAGICPCGVGYWWEDK